jgi:hypothetical protein
VTTAYTTLMVVHDSPAAVSEPYPNRISVVKAYFSVITREIRYSCSCKRVVDNFSGQWDQVYLL